jgi:hypothetical protein
MSVWTQQTYGRTLSAFVTSTMHTQLMLNYITKQQTRDFIERYLISFPVITITFGVLYT